VPKIEEYCGPKYPPSLLSLTLSGAQIRRLPHIDLDELKKLQRLAIIGATEASAVLLFEIDLISATEAVSDLEYVEVHKTPITLSWLSYTKDSLRHLVLSNIPSVFLPDKIIKLEYVQVVELLWSGEDENDNAFISAFRTSFDFPGLKYFSVSQRCTGDDLSQTLALVEWCTTMCDLEVFALRLLNESTLLDDSITPFDISSTYHTIDRKRQITGYPKWCLIHGLVHVPPNHVNTPSFYIEVDGFPYPYTIRYAKDGSGKRRVEEALTVRAKLLCIVDQDKRFSETQETQRFWERYNPYDRNRPLS
jgi:hypothetical protein